MAEPVQYSPDCGKSLPDFLFERGLEFPCGGSYRCGSCRVRIVAGDVPVTEDMRAVLSEAEIASGWRLGCCSHSEGLVLLDIGEWTSEILHDDSKLTFEHGQGLAVAVDVGSTTLVAQLLDLASGEVLATETAINPQARFGADIMTRIGYDLEHPGELTRIIRDAVAMLLGPLRHHGEFTEVLLAGNTVMHHLFCGLHVRPLAAVPFETPHLNGRTFTTAALGWQALGNFPVAFLPNLGGFVGSDILTGIVAEDLDLSGRGLIDLGTNGEVVVSRARRIWCASTAAGPAFEAGRIRCGMRASSGAIHRVRRRLGDELEIAVLGGGAPRGICGSGLVDAVAAALALGILGSNGRFRHGRSEWTLVGDVVITQKDIRELQLAKAAVSAGLRLLGKQRGSVPLNISVAGAFGNYVDTASAQAIGLLPLKATIRAAGNTALRGVKMLLLAPSTREQRIRRIRRATSHVALAALPGFQDCFTDELSFPSSD